ncbi:MAG: LytTR family transcriptional regulator DNA-binding domain-containing protein [Clostridia bacterium]
MRVAHEINKMNNNYKLCLVSNYSEYLKDGYRVKADRYFTKPIDQNEFDMDMDDILKDFILENSYIIDTKVCKEKIMIKDILYVEILARKTYVHTKTNKYVTNYTLLHWKEVLKDYYFSQPHKSFYVNLQNIDDYDNHQIYL